MPDVRPLVGAIVFFAVLGMVFFVLYQFLVIRPQNERLEDRRRLALSELNSLYANVNTPQATTSWSEYISAVSRAKTVSEIDQIMANARMRASIERKRMELLKKIDETMKSIFYSSDVPPLNTTATEFRKKVNAATSLQSLLELEPRIDEEMTTAWRQYLLFKLSDLENDRRITLNLANRKWLYMSVENARKYILSSNWQLLRDLGIETSTRVGAIIKDTFERTAGVGAGSLVNIYVYDSAKKQMELLVGGARVLRAIYPQEVLSLISWSLEKGGVSYSYSVDVWETIKARATGADIAGVRFDNYANQVIQTGVGAGLGIYSLPVIYEVEVPEAAASLILEYEFKRTEIDIILAPVLE